MPIRLGLAANTGAREFERLLWKLIISSLAATAIAWWVARGYWRRRRASRQLRLATQKFPRQRERLERQFLEVAGSLGKPRGLRWTRCDLDGAPVFAIDRVNGDIYALVGVIIGFEAIEGGGMEDVEAVANLRNGSAVFKWHRGGWTTEGRAMFNLSPDDAIEHYKKVLQRVADEDLADSPNER